MAWTPDQEKAIIESGTNIIVSAGAGSGKTAVLTERTIRKLLNGTSINRLLILTFTNAAAQEMKDRIRTAIKKADLKEQLELIDSSYITTFDSFALSVVKKYYYVLGLSPNLSIMDSSIETLKLTEIIDEVFESLYGDSDFDKLIGDFCTKSDKPMKDIIKDMYYKFTNIIDKETYLNNYIEGHFSDNYLNDIINKYVESIIKTKDSINEHYKELSSRVNNKFLTDYNIEPLLLSNSYMYIKINLDKVGSPRKNKECEEDYKIYKDKIDEVLKKLKELTRFESIEEIKESILLTKPYIKAIINVVKRIDEKFIIYKNDNNLYTFSDIAHMSIDILKNNKDICEDLKQSFDEIMVDEYQDTSDIQEEFINLISNNNVYMVGDIKQSIYRFRHANPYIFRNKYDKYSNRDGGIKIDLLKNFRSRKEVLDNINLIFNLIMDNEVGDAEYKESHQMNFGNINYEESCKTNQNNNMEILSYNNESLEDFSKDEIEAFIIGKDIKDKIESKYLIVDKKTGSLRPVIYGDFSIIMDRGTSFDLYKKIFEYLNIPLLQIQNESLTLGDDLTVLSNLVNFIIKVNIKEYDDEFKYLYTSICRSFLYKKNDEDIFNDITNNKIFDSDLFNICKSININELSNLELINEIINKFNYYEKLISKGDIKESIIKIDYLKDLSINLSNINYTPIDFGEYLKDMLKYGSIEYSLNGSNNNSVKILNIHKSKGLEYSICYYSGLSKKINIDDLKSKFLVDSNFNIITPYFDNGIKQTILKDILIDSEIREIISEKIRLFYVALTRAKEKMIIVCPLKDKESYNELVPKSIRLKYIKISDMLQSIYKALIPYMKEVNLDNINLTKDYELIKLYNYKNKLNKTNEKILKKENVIGYEEINKLKFSKENNKLITKEEYENMKRGTDLHYLFEIEDFKNTNNPIVLKFLDNIDMNYIGCYKELEFVYDNVFEEKHGVIDLILEYEDYINIIDYKMKNIVDDAYIEQLNGYKKYIETLTSKKTNIFLYSILDNRLVNLKK